MTEVVDTRGLSCPQPVIMVLEAVKKIDKGNLEILVDTDTSCENVTRATENEGWSVKEMRAEGEGYRISISKE